MSDITYRFEPFFAHLPDSRSRLTGRVGFSSPTLEEKWLGFLALSLFAGMEV